MMRLYTKNAPTTSAGWREGWRDGGGMFAVYLAARALRPPSFTRTRTLVTSSPLSLHAPQSRLRHGTALAGVRPRHARRVLVDPVPPASLRLQLQVPGTVRSPYPG